MTEAHIPGTLGVILAGGESRRMGGGDKGLHDLGGQPMLAHVRARFAPQVERLILSANGPPERFFELGLPVVPDREANQLGPLAGVVAAMIWAEENARSIKAVATVTSDAPFLPPDLVKRLHEAAAYGPAIAVSNERRHPAIALWPMTLRGAVETALREQQRSLNAFAAQNSAVEVDFAFSEAGGRSIDPFFNANTPTELEDARAILKRRD